MRGLLAGAGQVLVLVDRKLAEIQAKPAPTVVYVGVVY